MTIDAIGAQGAIAEAILRRGGDYLLALEANRPATLKDVAAFFADPPPGAVDTFEATDGDHGRIAIRGTRSATTWPGCSRTGATRARSPSRAWP